MKVAVDTGPLSSGHAVRGIGVHTHELIGELKKLKTKGVIIDFVDFSSTDLSGYDLVHYQNFHPYFMTIAFSKPAPKVVLTIHDLIPLIYPKHYPSGTKGKIRFWIQKFLIKNVDAIITISETSKKDICRFLSVHPNKVHVIYLAPKKIFRKSVDSKQSSVIRKKYNLPQKFVLYVGDVNYNKNISTLIRACKIAKLPLVIVGKQALEIEDLGQNLKYLQGPQDWLRYLLGKPHPELAHFEGLLKEFQNNSNILRLGFVPENDLVTIYNLASVYCQPSIYEGFGLPVLEAMACGIPVVAAKTQALVEVANESALFADPKDPKDIAQKINYLMEDKKFRNKLVKKSQMNSTNYSWTKTAQETVRLYENIFVK